MSEPSPFWTAEQVVDHLKTIGGEKTHEAMARFGIATDNALGITNATLRPLARKLRKNQERAETLWRTGYREARILAGYTGEPTKITMECCRAWAADFNSWDVVDGVSDLFVDTPYWRDLIDEFAEDEREFVRRTAFAMLAWAAVHRKKEPDATLVGYLTLIEKHSTDPRNFVKKAVNWALRQIGKRSKALHGPALGLAEQLAASENRTARWIGKDAVRELNDAKVLERLGKKG